MKDNEFHTDTAERVALGLLLDEHPAPVHIEHLGRVMGRVHAEDAASGLERDGLAHVQGEMIHASRAAVRGAELSV